MYNSYVPIFEMRASPHPASVFKRMGGSIFQVTLVTIVVIFDISIKGISNI